MRTLARFALLTFLGSAHAQVAPVTLPFPGGQLGCHSWSLTYYKGEPVLTMVIGNSSAPWYRYQTQFLMYGDRSSPVSFTVLAAGYIDTRPCAPGSPVFLSKWREAALESSWLLGQLDPSGLLVYDPATPDIELDASELVPAPRYDRRFFNSGYCAGSCSGKCVPGLPDSPDAGLLVLRVNWR